MADKPASVTEWEAQQIARAAYFTTCRFAGRGKYDRVEHKTQAEAEAFAAKIGDGRTMIYAITPEGWTIHIKNL